MAAKKTVEKKKKETVEEIVETKVEKTIGKEVVKTKAEIKRELRQNAKNIEVEVLNMTNGEFFYRCKKTHEELNLQEKGDTDVVTLDFLMTMKNQHRTLLERLDLVILDVYADYEIEDILEYLGLTKIYGEERFDIDYIENAINDMEVNEFSNLVDRASIGLVIKMAERGIQLAKEGGFDSNFKRSCIAKRLGKDDLFDI